MPYHREAGSTKFGKMKLGGEIRPTEKVIVQVAGQAVEVEVTKPPWADEDPELWEAQKMETAKPIALTQLRESKLRELKSEDRERIEALKKAFDEFDTDGSGELSTEEVINILTRMGGGAAMSEDDAKAFIAEFDADHDGAINLSEVCVYLRPWGPLQRTSCGCRSFGRALVLPLLRVHLPSRCE